MAMRIGKADCGLQYAVRKSVSSVGYCSLSIKCGTRDEEGFHSGIAHFTEHTLFKGTEKKSSRVINGYLDRLGGELNAYTTKEEIVLHATVLKEDLPKAVNLLLELATSPTFPEEEIDIERGVVIDEINQYKDSPADDVFDKFEEKLFAGHPLGAPILGTERSVKAITSEELRRFVKTRFTPTRMALSIVAEIDEDEMQKYALKVIDKHFNGFSGEEYTRPACDKPKAVPFDIVKEKHNHEVNAVVGGIAPCLYDQKSRLATILMANILGGPASNSILNNELREKKGWVYGVECSYTQYSDTGILAISIGCDKENLQKCFKTIDKVISGLREKPMSQTKLNAARKQLLGQLAISSDNGETQCLSMGKSLLSYGTITSSDETRKQLESITPVDIQNAAIEIFNPEKLSKLVFV